jgi:hypothetical protein
LPLNPSNPAPYDTLATVTQLVRTVLADYIANVAPSPQGTANVNGRTLTWVSGPTFNIYFVGAQIQVAGQANSVQSVQSPVTLTLVNAVATGNGIPWSATIPTGDIFADSQAYVLPTVNLGWRKLLEVLDKASHPRLRNETIITSLPVAASSDPSVQQWIDWTGFFDGVSKTSTPALPQYFLSPLRLYERQSVPAGPNPNVFVPMHPASDGIPSTDKSTKNSIFDWREDKIYLNGAIVPLDLRVSYQVYFPDIVPSAGGFAQTPIPIMRAARALAYYTAGFFVDPRGGEKAQGWMIEGDSAAETMTNRQAKLGQRTSYRRIAVYNSSQKNQFRFR